jgi:cytochrome P450
MELLNVLEEAASNSSNPIIIQKCSLELDRILSAEPQQLPRLISSVSQPSFSNRESIFRALRTTHPIIIAGQFCVATSYDSVTSILANHFDFQVPYAEKMKFLTEDRNFFLGQDDDDSTSNSCRAVSTLLFSREEVLELYPSVMISATQSILEKCSPQINVISDYLQPSIAKFACNQFGLVNVDERNIYHLSEILFEYLFIDIENNKELKSRAAKARNELRAIINDQLRDIDLDRKHTIIARGKRMIATKTAPITTTQLCDIIMSLLIGLIPTTCMASALTFDWLMNKVPSILKKLDTSDQHQSKAIVREGMRLNPINIGTFRVAKHDVTLSTALGVKKIPKGSMVLASTMSAMRDSTFITEPNKVLLNRPSSAYLYDGYGLHACLGRYANVSNVQLLIGSLISSGYMPVSGKSGKLKFSGRFPDELISSKFVDTIS